MGLKNFREMPAVVEAGLLGHARHGPLGLSEKLPGAFDAHAINLVEGRAAKHCPKAALERRSRYAGRVDDVFDREYGGFCTTFTGSRDNFRLEALTGGLGTQYEVMNTSLKFYACAASNHAAIDAIRTIRRRRPFEPGEIARIVVHGSEAMKKHVFWKYEPGAITTAQFPSFTTYSIALSGVSILNDTLKLYVYDNDGGATARIRIDNIRLNGSVIADVPHAPEPSTLALVGLGAFGFGAAKLRHRRKNRLNVA